MKCNVAFLWFISFLVILPLLAQKWVFSPLFFSTQRLRDMAADLVDDYNHLRYLEAEKFFQNFGRADEEPSHEGESKDFAVVVITRKRFVCNEADEFDCEPHYLQQTLAALHRERKLVPAHSIPIIVCNVDSHWEGHLDFVEILKFFPIIMRYENKEDFIPSNKKQETSDYAFCLEEVWKRYQRFNYLIAFEDDAIVFDNFFHTINSILKYRIETRTARGEKHTNELRWCWMKLYFPEFWSGFGWDANRLWELFWIFVAGGMIGTILAFLAQMFKRSKIFVFWWACNGALYLLLLVFFMGRPTWLEIRRIHEFLMQVTTDSGCCSTVGVIYPMDEVPKIVGYLQSSICRRCSSGVDLAIRDYKDKFKMLGFLVQPNLARHIGLHSTVSADYKDPIQMLFYDFLSWR
ncbi:Post-GPI attachment to proteins factor 4 [Pseudolycoriella hygida]|uniref:Post-GPI attachment to proteins factor 4 n=1 Tax=Pseudolycoriella hygida TaxID=35572 RepID=A0A9Q0NAR9_9DIPT|nr:Post-GPI attachment to proteins factor 4 [Pseudolycoriella hygida]